MRRIWTLRKDKEKRKSLTPGFWSDQNDVTSYLQNVVSSTKGVGQDSKPSSLHSGSTRIGDTRTKENTVNMSALIKPEYDNQVTKNTWLNFTSNATDVSEDSFRLCRAELRGSHLLLFKPPSGVEAKNFRPLANNLDGSQIAMDSETEGLMDNLTLNGELTRTTSSLNTAGFSLQLQTDSPSPELKYDYNSHSLLPGNTVELLVHYMLFDSRSEAEASVRDLIKVLPMFPNFDVVLAVIVTYLKYYMDNLLEGAFNVKLLCLRVLHLLAVTKEKYSGLLLKSDLSAQIIGILDALHDCVLSFDESLLNDIDKFKSEVLTRQQEMNNAVTYNSSSSDPRELLSSLKFLNEINLMDLAKSIDHIDLSFINTWSARTDESILLNHILHEPCTRNGALKKNPLLFNNDHHIHYLARLMIVHLFEDGSKKGNSSPEKRARILERWIDLACILEKTGNISAWYGIVSVIISPPILRLAKVWSHVSSSCIKVVKNDWSPVLFEFEKKILMNTAPYKHNQGSYQGLEESSSRVGCQIMIPRGIGKLYSKENVVPYFGDLVIKSGFEDPKELAYLYYKHQDIFSSWDDFLTHSKDYPDVIKYNANVLAQYYKMGWILSNESLNQVLHLHVDELKHANSDLEDTYNFGGKYNEEMCKKLLKLIELNVDSLNLEMLMKYSIELEPDLPETYLQNKGNTDASSNLSYTLKDLSTSSDTRVESQLSTSHHNKSTQFLAGSAASKIPLFNNHNFKIDLGKYDNLYASGLSPSLSQDTRLNSMISNKEFLIGDDLVFGVDNFTSDVDSSLVSDFKIESNDSDFLNGDDAPGLGIDVERIFNTHKFDEESDKTPKGDAPTEKGKKLSSLISTESFHAEYSYFPKEASVDKLIDLLLIDSTHFNGEITVNLAEYREVFLLNYSAFISTKELLETLSDRFMRSGNAVVSIMKKNFLARTDARLDHKEFPNWHYDDSVNLADLGDVDYGLLLKIQINILKLVRRLVDHFTCSFINDSTDKALFVKLLKLFGNEIVQWHNSGKLEGDLEHQFGLLVSLYNTLKKAFVKKLYRPVEVLKFEKTLIEKFRFTNKHGIPDNKQLPSAGNFQRIEKFMLKLNNLLTFFYKGITPLDWFKLFKILEWQLETNTLLAHKLQKPSTSEQHLIISNIFDYFETMLSLPDGQLLLDQFPLVFRKLFKLYYKFRCYLLIQVTDRDIPHALRLEKMKTFLLMIKISKLKMADTQFIFEGFHDNVPSYIESAVANVVYSPLSRCFNEEWIEAAQSLDGVVRSSPEDVTLLLPSNISHADLSTSGPLLPCFGWVIENFMEVIKCPNFHGGNVNFNKAYLVYKIIRELSIESDGISFEDNFDREFEFLKELNETLVKYPHYRVLPPSTKAPLLFQPLLKRQQKILAIDNTKKSLQNTNYDNQSTSSNNQSATLGLSFLNSKRQSGMYKANSSSRFKISSLFGKSKSSTYLGRTVGYDELASPQLFEMKQKPFLTIALKTKRIFPVYLFSLAFKVDSDSNSESYLFQANTDDEFNEWLEKLNFAKRHWFYSKNLNLRHQGANITFGVPLNYICTRDGSTVPSFLVSVLKELETRGLNEVGIYRISPSTSELNQLKLTVDRTGSVDFETQSFSSHALTSIVKLYFRELPESILTDKLICQLFNYQKTVSEHMDITVFVNNYKAIFTQLPENEFYILKLLFGHLKKIADASEENKMNASNLATVLCPALTEPSGLPCLVLNFGFMNPIVEKCITFHDQIFGSD